MGDNQHYLAFIRVTLLGMARSGKSSLVNNIVNNAFSPTYSKTTESTLYYSTVRITGEQDSLLELEDVFGSDDVGDVAISTKVTEERQVNDFYDFWWPSTQEKSMREQKRLKASESPTPDAHGTRRLVEKPFGLYKAPVDGSFRPLTKNRMAYLIVFDANDESSYKEAVRVYEGLKEYHEKKNSSMLPLINFVANKIDKDPTADVFCRVTASARAYADFNSVPLHQVSALQFSGVKKMFRGIVQAVKSNQLLWMLEVDVNNEEEDGTGGKCTIQ